MLMRWIISLFSASNLGLFEIFCFDEKNSHNQINMWLGWMIFDRHQRVLNCRWVHPLPSVLPDSITIDVPLGNISPPHCFPQNQIYYLIFFFWLEIPNFPCWILSMSSAEDIGDVNIITSRWSRRLNAN